MSGKLTLVSHYLCPYVQRGVIALSEKQVPFDRVYVDLANKPEWFGRLSPLGKTPVLKVGDTAIFESAVILEYLEETSPRPLHPADPLARAGHRSTIEFGSSILNDIAGFYNARDAMAFWTKVAALSEKFDWIEERLDEGPYFSGKRFSLVDAVYGPIFRYFDVFDRIAAFGILDGKPNIARWRQSLADRPSVRNAVVADYGPRLLSFIEARNSHLSELVANAGLFHTLAA
jgi:glutathione S-transferase